MAAAAEANGRMPGPATSQDIPCIPDAANAGPEAGLRKRPDRPRRPNYALIHSKPFPLETYPLPAFHPANPISILRFAYAYLYQLLTSPSSHAPESYLGYFSSETRSVHVTNPKHVRALWEMGFFGKGTLSRSEPSWLDRERARLKTKRVGGGTAEEATNVRREKRRLFKLERARAEAQKIERQRLVEEGKLDPSVLEDAEKTAGEATTAGSIVQGAPARVQANESRPLITEFSHMPQDEAEDILEPTFQSQEHLQLSMEEAFFLSYGVGVLQIRSHELAESSASDGITYCNMDLLRFFCAHSFFPPTLPPYKPAPDDQFLLNYIVYHHFRSLGWVVRAGVKFSVDYLLYFRGPVFSHAEFAIMIIPAYEDSYWSTERGQRERRVKEQVHWDLFHCINRVQSQVLKTLVLCYVEVPPPMSVNGDELDIGKLLKRYKVKEFIVKRWLANRSRD